MKEYSRVDLIPFCESQLKTFAQRQLVLLEGELGAGKTTLVQTIASLLGHKGAESPTFSIINEYPTVPKITHVDLYRMENAEDLESTGFWDIFDQDAGFIFIEWSSRVPKEHWPRAWSPVQWVIGPGSTVDHRTIDVKKISF